MKSYHCLFIGGPMDGQRIEVPEDKIAPDGIHIAVTVPKSGRIVTIARPEPLKTPYRLSPLVRIETKGEVDVLTIWLMVEASLSDAQAFELLITGYRNPEPYKYEVH